MAVVKADAYGHGLRHVLPALADDVDAFAVATVDEGIECRNLHAMAKVVVLSEFWSERCLAVMAEHGLDVVVHHPQHVDWVAKYRGQKISVWLKLDTGMNRLGLATQEVRGAYNMCRTLPTVADLKVMTHLACADDSHDTFNDYQQRMFHARVSELARQSGGAGGKFETSLANSAGSFSGFGENCEWIRPGLALYGVSPFAAVSTDEREALALKPVMTLQSRVISTRWLNRGSHIGYGKTFTARRDSRIAVAGFGYGDGYPWSAGNRSQVVMRGQRVPVVGRVSMDMIAIDITDLPAPVKLGDIVTLWGAELPVSEVAEQCRTIPYELLCRVASRIPRVAIASQ